jgi:hypothetical protein
MKRNYILIRYRYGEGGGDAIVLYEAHQDRSFRVLGRGGGAMDAGIISAFGVPKPIATTLVQYAAGKCPSQYRVELKNRAVANDAKGCTDASTRR